MEYKITSIYPQAYCEIATELLNRNISFRYNAQDETIIADIEDDVKNSFIENIHCICVPSQPSQAEVNELNEELYELLEQAEDNYIELDEPVWATYRSQEGNGNETIGNVEIDSIMLNDYSITFYFGSEYVGCEYFDRADQVKIYEQAIATLNNGKEIKQ